MSLEYFDDFVFDDGVSRLRNRVGAFLDTCDRQTRADIESGIEGVVKDAQKNGLLDSFGNIQIGMGPKLQRAVKLYLRKACSQYKIP